jgi:hypothetical protein
MRKKCNHSKPVSDGHACHDPVSFSLPFREGVASTRLGELAIADGEVYDPRRRVLLGGLVGYLSMVGVPGREVLLRDGGEPLEDAVSPAAASVRRNSTQRREKD